MTSAYRDLFLVAALVTRGSAQRKSVKRLRVRILDQPPDATTWLRLSHDDDPNIHESELSDDSSAESLLHAMLSGDARPLSIMRQVKQTWDLFEDWLPGVIQSILEASRDTRPVRLNVVTATPSLWLRPWEWLEFAIQKLPHFADFSINRAVPMRVSPPRLPIRDPLRLFVLPSNPQDESRMNVLQELAAIPTPAAIERLNAHSATAQAVAETLNQFEPNIVHYVGHAGVDGCEGNLILETESRSTAWLDPQTVERQLPPSTRLLCLSTCVTAPNYDIRGFAHFALGDSGSRQNSLPSIVYTQFPVHEDVSQAFWNTFYQQLLATDSDLTAAVQAGRKAARKASRFSTDWSSFVLVLRDQFNADAGRPFQLADQSPAPARAGAASDTPDRRTSPEDLQDYFASLLANQLETLDAASGPSNSRQVRDQVDDIKKFIKQRPAP